MRTMHTSKGRTRIGFLITAAAGAVMASTPLTLAQHAEVEAPQWRKTSEINAALLYHRAWMVHDHQFRKIRDMEMRDDAFTDEGQPRGELLLLLDESQEFVEALLVASKSTWADWGVEYEQGIYALLPHLAHLRNSVRTLNYDAQRRLALGDRAGAVERAAAIYRIARHSSNDGVLISSLVGVAIAGLGNSAVNTILDSGPISQKEASVLLDAIDGLHAHDALGMRKSMLGEKEIFLNWFEDFMLDPSKNIFQKMGELNSLTGADFPAMRMAALGKDGMINDVTRAKTFYDEALEVWDTPDAVERLKELEGRVSTGDFGLVARVMAPSLTRSREAENRVMTQLAETRARVLASVTD